MYSAARRERGFTLLELVVVLALIGIILGFARLSFGDGGAAARVEHDARTLAAALRLAQEEALLDEREFGLRLGADGYAFMRLVDRHWRPLQDAQALRTRHLDGERRLTLSVDGQAVPLPDALQQVDQPQVFLLSSGEATPFCLAVADRPARAWHVCVTGDGVVDVTPPEHG